MKSGMSGRNKGATAILQSKITHEFASLYCTIQETRRNAVGSHISGQNSWGAMAYQR